MAWRFILLFITAIRCNLQGFTPAFLKKGDIRDMHNVAVFGDGLHRGPKWYEDDSWDMSSDLTRNSGLEDVPETSWSSYSTYCKSRECEAHRASSAETKERRIATRLYRDCTPCPTDMVKKHKNKGIEWMCASYQRARRTFKSECMMRYRNCQDGTMFVKLYDQRCKDDPYNGRHWFYVYGV